MPQSQGADLPQEGELIIQANITGKTHSHGSLTFTQETLVLYTVYLYSNCLLGCRLSVRKHKLDLVKKCYKKL